MLQADLSDRSKFRCEATKKTSRRMREVSAPGDVAQLPDALGDNDHATVGHAGILPHPPGRLPTSGPPVPPVGTPAVERPRDGSSRTRVRRSTYVAAE